MGGGGWWQAAQSANKSRWVWGYRPRTVRLGAKAVELVGTGCRVPGRVKSPHAVDVTQPRVLFRVCPLHFAEVACILRASACPSASARPGALICIRDTRLVCNERNQVQRLDGRRSISPGWAQDGVSQDPEGSLCNNLPSQVGKSQGQCCDCYGAAIQDRDITGSAAIQGRLGDLQLPAFCGGSWEAAGFAPRHFAGFPLLTGARAPCCVWH